MARNRRIVALGALALAGALLVYAVRRSGEPAPPAYESAPVARGPLSERVTATGTLSPLVTVQVGSQVSGRIQELLADFNSPVSRGQVIARIDPLLFESDVEKARAGRAMAEAAVRKAEADLFDARLRNERAASLAARELTPRADADAALAAFQAAEAALASARASVAQARAALEQAERQLAYTTIVSPIDGIVISRDVDVGQTVAASLQAPVLFTIAEDLRKMELHTHVAEADMGRLRPGMPAEFTVDAHPARPFHGAVRQIRYAPETVQNVVTYDAVVAVDNPDLLLRPGMTADVAFLVQERADALLVPNAALRFAPPDAPQAPPPVSGPDARVVWVLDGSETLRPVAVQVGITDGHATEILGAGLAEGDRVVTGIAGGGARPDAEQRNRFGRFL